MALAVQSSTKASQASPPTINKPSGTTDGDLLVLIYVNSNSAQQVDTPSGWTLVARFGDGTVNSKINVFYKIASGEPTSYSYTTPANTSAYLLRITGFESTGMMYVEGEGNQTNSTTPSIAAGVTPSVTNSLLIMISATNNVGSPTTITNQAIATSNPTWSKIQETTDITYGTVAIAVATRPETTATGNVSFTNDGSSSTDNMVMLLGVKRQITFSASNTDQSIATEIGVSAPRSRIISIMESASAIDIVSSLKDIWSEVTRVASSWVNGSKNSSSYSNSSKNSSSYDYESKN